MTGAFAGGRDVIVANHAEFNRSWMHGFTARERWPWDAGANALSDQCLFWGGAAPKTIFMAGRPDELLVRDAMKALGGCDIEVVSVGKPPFVSRTLADDEALLDEVARRLGRGGDGKLYAWGLTRGLIALIGKLKDSGCEFTTPGLAAPEFFPEALELDSKAGARFFLTRNGVPMPGGTIVTTIEEAANAARYFVNHGSGAVVKADNGSGGFAVRPFTKEQIATRPDYVLRDLELRARLDGAWRAPLFIVERLAEQVSGEGPVAPTTDWIVAEDGSARCVGTGMMTMRHRSLYCGVTAGVGALGVKLESGSVEIGRKVAALLAGRGFRGWFDVDLVADGEDNVYATELNMRRTCPAHAFELAGAREGVDWAGKCCVKTIERFSFGSAARIGYGEVSAAIAEWNGNAARAGVFAVASGATSCLDRPRPEVGLVVIAPNAASAEEACASLGERLAGLGGGKGGG